MIDRFDEMADRVLLDLAIGGRHATIANALRAAHARGIDEGAGPFARARAAQLRAISVWGRRPQLDQLTEKAGEVIAAVNHVRRARDGAEAELRAELADLALLVVGLVDADALLAAAERLERRLTASEGP